MSEKNKKMIIISSIAMVSLILAIIVFFNISIEKQDGINTIIPEEEISDSQLRETTVNIYLVGENNELISIMKKIDSKELLNNPYEKVLLLLFEEPNEKNLSNRIPRNTQIKEITKEGDCLIVNLSEDFFDGNKENKGNMENAKNQIEATLTQFTEINKVIVLVEGKDIQQFLE